MVGTLMRVLREQKAAATVIIPGWEGRHWWPIVCPDGYNWASFVVDWKWLPPDSIEGASLFKPGAGRANEVSVGPPKFDVYALRVDFR
jgi:hypothetical protein